MSVINLEFKNEEDRRAARDINLAMLESEGWKPREDLSMLVVEDRAAAFKRKLDEAGIEYRETPAP